VKGSARRGMMTTTTASPGGGERSDHLTTKQEEEEEEEEEEDAFLCCPVGGLATYIVYVPCVSVTPLGVTILSHDNRFCTSVLGFKELLVKCLPE
jgi:hypothetical protein